MILRLLIILGIVYASLLGGVVEHVPTLRITHQVLAVLVLGSWLVYVIRRQRSFPATRFDAPLLLAGLFWIMAALLARDPRVSLEYTWSIWVHILLFYLVVDLIRHTRQGEQWVIEGVFLTGALIVFMVLLETTSWYFGLGVLPQFSQSWPDLFGLSIPPVIHEAAMPLNYNNPNASYCLLVIPMAWLGAETVRQRDLRWGLRSLAVGLVLAVLLTQSRGGYLGLAALLGLMAVVWLLRAENRRRFPVWIQPLLAPPQLIGGTVLGVAIVGGLLFWKLVLTPQNPSWPDVARIDLWYSAIEMFHDHPITGVGPRQFGTMRLWYPHWQWSYAQLPLQHAHSLYFNWLAEGGIIGVALGIGLVVRLAHIGWDSWQQGSPTRRRRLEGVGIGLAAFAVHNTVDAFLQTQLMIPVLIMAAYIVASAPPAQANPPRKTPSRRRAAGVALGALIVVQIIFIPLHWAVWQHNTALSHIDEENYPAALDAIQAAQRVDPWQTLYQMQEATILGHLAYQEPELYLNEAMAAYQDSLNRFPAWANGWFNLGTLYAQSEQYGEAVQAIETALDWDPVPRDYWFKLGEYYLVLDNNEAAQAAFFQTLERGPAIASSAYWIDPAHPERAAILANAFDYFKDSALLFDLAVYTGNFEFLETQVATPRLRSRYEALYPDETGTPCLNCFYLDRRYALLHPKARYYLRWGERLLHDDTLPAPDNLTAEKAARAALFLSESETRWSWYILARQANHETVSAQQIEAWLARAVLLPGDYRSKLPTTVFGVVGHLGTLPYGDTPRMSRNEYVPWLELAARHEQNGEWESAREIYQIILEFAPYDPLVKARLAALHNSSQAE